MYTDFYFTNLSTDEKIKDIVFSQNTSFETPNIDNVFASIKGCPFNWCHKIRVSWSLSFRLKKKSGNLTPIYNLKTVHNEQRPFFLIYKEGSTSVQQTCNNGNQIILFKQIKGNEFIAIQLYRGDLLIKEQFFNTSKICFQIDSNINILTTDFTHQEIPRYESKNTLCIDFIPLKSVHLILLGSSMKHQLVIDAIKKW
ncbi:hypothetical protein [Tenacibaculum sp. 190524A02b]|uniref:Uncharacterized protein n=1 Tax=Tenacibaculum vairaonense TaxID=3137860 RepID=A0ABP1FEQ3_9FLAO